MDASATLAFESWLRAQGRRVAMLRHRIDGLEHLETSDWDVAVRDSVAAGESVEATMGKPWVRILRQYVEQRFYDWNQVDFLPVFEWHGAEYLSQESFWDGVDVGADGLSRPRVAHDAFIAWMIGLLWGGNYKSRFDGLIQRALAEDQAAFRAALEWAFGRAWAGQLLDWAASGDPARATLHARALRRALRWQSFRREPGVTLWRGLTHWWIELCHHWRPSFPWFAVLGPDGSGKSSVIAALRERLRPSRLEFYVVHWRPSLRGHDEPGRPVTDPHGLPPHSLPKSLVQVLWLVLRWWAARLGRPWHLRAKRALMLSDRHHADLLADPRRYRYGGPMGWARGWFKTLPQPDRVAILLADPDEIFARKQEVPRHELERQLAAYRALAGEIGDRAVIVDAGQSLECVVAEVLAAFFPGSSGAPPGHPVGTDSPISGQAAARGGVTADLATFPARQ
jgi:thymidylate kinase